VTIEQTVEIPKSRRLTFDIPKEVPIGRARVVIQFPVPKETQENESIPPEAKGQSKNKAFRCAISQAYGAWKDNPWVNHLEDINAMRNEWDHRDPWNPDSGKRHQD
jgi:hypothetical protein